MIALIVLDGWGLSPNWQGNAVGLANPPFMDELWRTYPHAVLEPYKTQTGREEPKVGSSDVGHAILGAGRLLQTDLDEILAAIRSGSFIKNPTLLRALEKAASANKRLHLIGIVSDGGVHGDPKIMSALAALAKNYGISEIYLHVVTDGRDVLPTSAKTYLDRLAADLKERKVGTIATVIGRHWAMDRDHHWDRTKKAYELWTGGKGEGVRSVDELLRKTYAKGSNDEMMPGYILDTKGRIGPGDTVIVCNTRADRLQQLVQAFIDKDAFRPLLRRQVPMIPLTSFVSLVSPRLVLEGLDVAFPPAVIRTMLPEVIAGRGLKQLRVAESEKTAHVTYMFDGGRLEPYPYEDRLIIPSASTAQKRGDVTAAIVEKTLKAIRNGPYDFVLINLAEVDLTAHEGDLIATSQAVTHVDAALRLLTEGVLARGGTVLVTADHGNAEQMLGLAGSVGHRAHTTNPVPFVLAAEDRRKNLVQQATTPPASFLANMIRTKTTLADVAPTILELFVIPIPVEMTGTSLLHRLQ